MLENMLLHCFKAQLNSTPEKDGGFIFQIFPIKI